MNTADGLTASELWYEEAFDSFPAVVAHEYWRLRELLSGGQIYGALLQTKDLFEVILKLPTLAYAAYLYRAEREPNEDRLLADLLKEPLSLGSWESLARRALNQVELPATAQPLEKHLSDVLGLFSKHGIVKWRNDVIGHGALSLNEAHDLERDIAALLRAAQAFFRSQDAFYRTFEMNLQGPASEPIPLRGVKGARLAEGDAAPAASGEAGGKAAVFLQMNGFSVDLYPFVFLSEGDIFFFDSFLVRKERSCVISYPPGFRKNEHLPEVLELAQAVDLATAMASVQGGFSEATYLAENDAVIQSLFRIEDFRRPDYLVDWLSASMKAQGKGIFHLSMEMGMGKSTFARALDPTKCGSEMAISLKNASVRGYFLNDSYLSTAEAFCNAVTDSFNRDRDGSPLFQSSTTALPRLMPGSENPGRDFADLLRFYRDAYERHYGTSRLLFVLDGLEEIPAGQARSILDFLPRPEELSDGVYILLTTRLAEELPPHLRSVPALREAAAAQVVDRRHEGYLDILRSYVRANVLVGTAAALDPETVMVKAESRFLYARLYRDLLRAYGGDLPEALPEGSDLLERYLDRLRRLIGDKFQRRATELLAILSSAYEPLTLKEIAYLSGREEVDFLMLAYMADLRAFFKTERSYRGNLVSLHAEWKSAGKTILAPTIRALVVDWIADNVWLPAEALDADNEGLTYLLSRLTDYGKDYEIDYDEIRKKIATTQEVMEIFISHKRRAHHEVDRQLMLLNSCVDLYGALGEQNLADLATAYERRASVLDDLIHSDQALADLDRVAAIRERLDAQGRLADREDLVSAYANRGLTLVRMQRPSRAVTEFERALKLQERLAAEGHPISGDNLATIYSNLAATLQDLQQPDLAIANYDRAIAVLEDLQEEGRLRAPSALANGYMNRGNVMRDLLQPQRAIADYGRAIEMQERLRAEGHPVDLSDVARAYRNRGTAFDDLLEPERALADYERAIEIGERLDAEGLLLDRNDLAMAYASRGSALSDLQRPERAIVDYGRAIEIQKKLEAEGRLGDRNSLALAYTNRGNAMQHLQCPEEAITDYGRAIAIREELDREGRFPDQNGLAIVYENRGGALRDLQQPERAIADFDRAIEIRERLVAEGRLLDPSDLASAYHSRANALCDCQRQGDALADYGCAIELLVRLDTEGKLLDRDTLAAAYTHRGYALSELRRFEAAMADQDTAIVIRERLDAEGKLLDRNHLAEAYMNRGATLQDQGRPERAILDVERAVEIRERLREEGKLNDPNDLAKMYSNRGDTYRMLNQPERALVDFDRAIDMQECLDAAGKLLDRHSLAMVYDNRGRIFAQLGQLEQSLVDYGRAIELQVALDAEGRLLDKKTFAMTLVNRGHALRALAKTDEALADYDRAVAVLEALAKEGRLLNADYLALALMNRGNALLYLGKGDRALADYDRAIEIREGLDSEGRLLDKNDLAAAYLDRGEIHRTLGLLEPAVTDYSRALEVLERLDTEGRLSDRVRLASVYQTRGGVFMDLGLPEQAVPDFSRIIELRERLESEGMLSEGNDLVTAYMCRGLAYSRLEDLESAILDCDRAAAFGEKLAAEGKLHDRSILEIAFYSRAGSLRLLGKYRESLESYRQSYAIAPDRGSFNLACLHALLGEIDDAFRYLEENRQSPSRPDREVLISDTDLTALHEDPRWEELVSRWDEAARTESGQQ